MDMDPGGRPGDRAQVCAMSFRMAYGKSGQFSVSRGVVNGGERPPASPMPASARLLAARQ